jgi:DNA-binding protein H-NS
MAVKKQPTVEAVLDFDFEQLDFEQLNSLSAKLLGIISERKEKEKQAFIDETREKANQLGLNFEEIFKQASEQPKKQRQPTKPKYELIYEDGSRVTWSGKGRMKKEFADWKEENPDSSIDELLISEED